MPPNAIQNPITTSKRTKQVLDQNQAFFLAEQQKLGQLRGMYRLANQSSFTQPITFEQFRFNSKQQRIIVSKENIPNYKKGIKFLQQQQVKQQEELPLIGIKIGDSRNQKECLINSPSSEQFNFKSACSNENNRSVVSQLEIHDNFRKGSLPISHRRQNSKQNEQRYTILEEVQDRGLSSCEPVDNDNEYQFFQPQVTSHFRRADKGTKAVNSQLSLIGQYINSHSKKAIYSVHENNLLLKPYSRASKLGFINNKKYHLQQSYSDNSLYDRSTERQKCFSPSLLVENSGVHYIQQVLHSSKAKQNSLKKDQISQMNYQLFKKDADIQTKEQEIDLEKLSERKQQMRMLFNSRKSSKRSTCVNFPKDSSSRQKGIPVGEAKDPFRDSLGSFDGNPYTCLLPRFADN